MALVMATIPLQYTVHVDTRELDAALDKARALDALRERLEARGEVVAIAGLALVEALPRPLSRRGVLGLNWLRRDR